MFSLRLIVALCIFGSIVCPPVKEPAKEKEKPKTGENEKPLGLQYERYLKEVVNVLEEDEGFRKKLEEANVTDIKPRYKQPLDPYQRYVREVISLLAMEDPKFIDKIKPVKGARDFKDIIKESGDIAQHLEFVSHRVRSQLDELKRKEVDRLNMVKKMMDVKNRLKEQGEAKLRGDKPGMGIKPLPDIGKKLAESMLKHQGLEGALNKRNMERHIDMRNPETFEVEDLKKLIVQATNDLEDMDRKRKDEFKVYEMEKEALRREKLKQMTERERQEAEEKFKQQQKKHREHPKVNHPGSKDQLEEVWEEGDGMDKEDFDPRTFFFMRDTNGDGVLDYVEIEALFQRELDKIYDEDATEDDMMERYEEMSRMREHVYKEVDKNRDGLISLEEFMDSARDPKFDEKEEWDTLDDEEIYTEEELQQFEREMRERMRQRAFDGHVQPGEIPVPVDPSMIPPIHDNFAGQRHENVQQMQQQQFQQPPQHQQQFQQPPKQQQFQQPPQQQQFQQPPQHQQQQQQQFQQPPQQQQFQNNQVDPQAQQQVHQQEQAIDPEQDNQEELRRQEENIRLLQEQQQQRQQEFEQNRQEQEIQQQAGNDNAPQQGEHAPQQADDAPQQGEHAPQQGEHAPPQGQQNEQVLEGDNNPNKQLNVEQNQQQNENAQNLEQGQENVEPAVVDNGQQ